MDVSDDFGDGGRDYAAAAAVVDEIGRVTLEVVRVWPLHRLPRSDAELAAFLDETVRTRPVLAELGRIVDQHGLFTVLSVALGWAGAHVRDLLNAPLGAQLVPGSYELAYPSSPRSRELDGVVGKLLEHSLLGVDGVAHLYDAADLLRHDPHESVRVLVGVLDLCAALREHVVIAGHRW